MKKKQEAAPAPTALADQFESDSKEAASKLPDDETLKRVSTLSQKQVQLENEIEKKGVEIQKLQEQLNGIRDRELPELLISFGLMDIKLTTGERVQVQKIVSASISKERADAAFGWLEKNGFGALIKYKMEIDTGKGEKKLYTKARAALVKLGLAPVDKKNVHPQTLAAFVREQLEKAAKIPLDVFGVYTINRSKVS